MEASVPEVSGVVVSRARALKAAAERLSQEAERCWSEVQTRVQSKQDAAEKSQRLRQLKQEMDGVSAEYVSLVSQNPGVVLRLEQPLGTTSGQLAPVSEEADAAAAPGAGGAGAAPERLARTSGSSRRSSLFSTQSLADIGGGLQKHGGRQCAVQTRSALLGELECVVLEPQGKRAAPAEYVTTGLIICLQGLPPSAETLDEWGRAVQLAGWLQLGATVVLPNLQMSAALVSDDVAAVLDAVCQLVQCGRCIIVCKDLFAHRAVEVAVEGGPKNIVGLVLVGPSLPAPEVCSQLLVPVLLLWARDDEVSPFEDRAAWLEALSDSRAVAAERDLPTGGHQVDDLLRADGAAEMLRHFTIAALLLADLVADGGVGQLGQSENDKAEARMGSLASGLPQYIREMCRSEDEDSEEESGTLALPRSTKRLLASSLPRWIAAGMVAAVSE